MKPVPFWKWFCRR